jgi:hypothetical protein
MMPVNRALAGRAAGSGGERPGGSGQRRIKKDDRNQAKHCEKRAPAVLMRNLHIRSKLPTIIRQMELQFQQAWPQALIFMCMKKDRRAVPASLDLACTAPQTRSMAHTYIRFDFGTDEEKAQQARHKLDGWRQAFRLDKRVQYKMDRPESSVEETVLKPEAAEKPAPATKSKGKPAAKATGKAEEKSSEPAAEKPEPATNSKVGLLIRLYFSSHEKLSEQRWIERIPSEEPFKSAAPRIIHQLDPEFEATDTQFESLA